MILFSVFTEDNNEEVRLNYAIPIRQLDTLSQMM